MSTPQKTKMFPSNLHTHTTYSDGSHPPEAYIQTALELRFVSIGFSDHQPTLYNCASDLKKDRISDYVNEVNALKRKYEGQIEVALGMETDIYGDFDTAGLDLDYVIGAVHWLKKPDGAFGPIDSSPEKFELLITAFGGVKNMAREYYARLADVIHSQPDILAHFDLITKFNSSNRYFDPEEDWHKELINDTVSCLTNTRTIVEINTGAIARGYRKTPYPHNYILRNLANKSIPITISADAHTPAALCHAFKDAVELAESTGHKAVMVYQDAGLKEVSVKKL